MVAAEGVAHFLFKEPQAVQDVFPGEAAQVAAGPLHPAQLQAMVAAAAVVE